MNTVSRTITGLIGITIGIVLTIIGLFGVIVALIYGLIILLVSIFILFNKKEDEIEKIKR